MYTLSNSLKFLEYPWVTKILNGRVLHSFLYLIELFAMICNFSICILHFKFVCVPDYGVDFFFVC